MGLSAKQALLWPAALPRWEQSSGCLNKTEQGAEERRQSSALPRAACSTACSREGCGDSRGKTGQDEQRVAQTSPSFTKLPHAWQLRSNRKLLSVLCPPRSCSGGRAALAQGLAKIRWQMKLQAAWASVRQKWWISNSFMECKGSCRTARLGAVLSS